MKKVIAITLILAVMIGITIAKVNYDKTHFTGYLYTPSGATFDEGFARGDVWVPTGEKAIYSLDELRALAKDHRVSITGILDGQNGLGITLMSDLVLVFPGIGWWSGLDLGVPYYLTF